MPEPEPLPSVVASIDQFLALVGEARSHRDPARWLENRLLEMRHAEPTGKAIAVSRVTIAWDRCLPRLGRRVHRTNHETKAGLRHDDLHRGGW